MTADERKFLYSEYVKCESDVTYMSKHYCDIQTLKYGKIKLDLYPFQMTTLSILSKTDKAIILKSRQLGISTIMSLTAIHCMLFQDGYRVSIFANKQKSAVEIIDKIKLIYNGLPTWLKGKEELLNNNKQEIKLPNGSMAKAFSSSSDEGRGISANLIIVDEAAFVDDLQQLYTSIMPSISTGGKIVMLSTPAVSSGCFFDLWNDALNNKNGFVPIKLKWDLLPTRTQAWRDQQDRDLGIKLAKQEFDAIFSQTGSSVFDDEIIENIEHNTVQKPRYTSGELHDEWYWQAPDYSRNYITILDTAMGSGGDDSTIQVLDLESFEQVYEYQGQLDPKSLAIKGRIIATEFNMAILVVENTGIGDATCLELEMLGYPNLFKTNKSADMHDMNQFINNYAFDSNLKTGFSNNVGTRPKLISKLQECLINQSITIRSSRTLHELKTFVWLNGKAQASRGSHDDLIMPLAIGCYLRETALMFASKSVIMSKELVSNIAIYKNNEFNKLVNNSNCHNQRIIDQYGLNGYDIWGTNS